MPLILSGDTGVPASGMPTGSVIQTVNATYSTEIINTTTSWADTNLTATITPLYASSKILVVVSQAGVGKSGADTRPKIRLLRSGSQIVLLDDVAAYNNSTATNSIGSVSLSYLDSPATTSATIYKTQFANVSGVGNCLVQWNSGTSTITLLEIKQ